jgi:hypothetical protein
MTTFSFLSHSKRLPHANAVNFDIGSKRFAAKNVAVAAPRFSLFRARREPLPPGGARALRWRAAGPLYLVSCAPRHQRAQGIDRHSLSESLRSGKLFSSIAGTRNSRYPFAFWIDSCRISHSSRTLSSKPPCHPARCPTKEPTADRRPKLPCARTRTDTSPCCHGSHPPEP